MPETNRYGLTYKEWYRLVDLEVEVLCGFGIEDLEDFIIRDAFDNDEEPKDTAREIVENDTLACSMLD